MRRGAFKGLTTELIDILNIWAGFIYGPLLDDRVRTIAEGTTPGQYGRKEAFKVHQALRKRGRVGCHASSCSWTAPRSGSAGVFLHLDAQLNYCEMFNETIHDFRAGRGGAAQAAAFAQTGVPLPRRDEAPPRRQRGPEPCPLESRRAPNGRFGPASPSVVGPF